MKLRNKKTGEIGEIRYENHELYVDTDEGFTYWLRTLAKLNEEWEDYEPKEPRINNEDARNAVRLWASLLQIQEVRCKKTAKAGDIEVITLEAFKLMSAPRFELADWAIDADLADGATYTIAELCGEEEE